MRKMGMGSDNSPSGRELGKFDEFISRLDDMAALIKSGGDPAPEKLMAGIIASLVPSFPRNKSKSDFGLQQVDEARCNRCGACAKGCPYEAIKLDPGPVFDQARCYGCWYCYNHCPQKAIHTSKFRGDFQYPHPTAEMMRKLV